MRVLYLTLILTIVLNSISAQDQNPVEDQPPEDFLKDEELIDEENKERIFMPTEKEFKDTTKGKDLYYSEFGRSSGHNFRLNCTKY